jgi:hypothetical protein
MPLVEQACKEEGVELKRENFFVSLVYALITFRHTPVIFVNDRLVAHGRMISVEEMRQYIREAKK